MSAKSLDDHVSEFLANKAGPFFKNNFDSGSNILGSVLMLFYALLVLAFLIIYGYLVTIAIQMSKARQYGKRLQEECGDIYMEAETARYQIFKTYSGDIATKLNQIKSGILSIYLIVITVLYIAILGSIYMERSDILSNSIKGKGWIIIFILIIGWMGSIGPISGTQGAFNKDYRDIDTSTSINNRVEKADAALTSLDGTFISTLSILLIIFFGYIGYVKYNNIDGSEFMKYKNHYFALTLIIVVLYIVFRLYTNMVNNMNNDILARYNNQVNSIQTNLTGLLSDSSAVNYFQNNLRRLEPNSTDTISSNTDFYRLIEHRLGQETYYYADATVPSKIKTGDMQGLINKFKTPGPASNIAAAIQRTTNQNSAEYSISSNILVSNLIDNNKPVFSGFTNTAASAQVGAELLDVLYQGYSVTQPYTSGQNIRAIFTEADIKNALTSVTLYSVSNQALYNGGAGNYTVNTNKDEIQLAFNATKATNSAGDPLGPSVSINIKGTPSTSVYNVTLKDVYLVFKQLKSNSNYANEADEIIKQMKVYLLHKMLYPASTNQTTITRNDLRTAMATLRKADYVETSTDDFTRLIAIGFIFPVLIVAALIYNKMYTANPSYTTMAVIIFIFMAVFAITWYAWFAGNILL